MKLDFCTGQIPFLLQNKPSHFSISPIQHYWLVAGLSNLKQLIFKMFLSWSNVPKIWYELYSNLLWSQLKLFFGSRTLILNLENGTWDIPDNLALLSSRWVQFLSVPYYPHVQNTCSLSPSGKKWRLCFQPAVENWRSSATRAEKLVFKRLISQTGFPRL